MATTVNITELRKAIGLLLDHVAEANGDSVEISHDAYWHIGKESAYNPYEEPSEFTLGQLDEDWDSLQKVANKQDDPIGYALVWASSVLKAVGEKVP